MNPWISFGLRILAVLFVLGAATFKSLILGLMPVVLIFTYAIVVWWKYRKDPSKLDVLADQVYFLGYLSTIAAFAGIVLSTILTGKLPDNPTALLLMVAVALIATVAGLLAMTWLKDIASSQRQKLGPLGSEWEQEVLKQLKTLVELFGLSSESGIGNTPHTNPLLESTSIRTAEVIKQINTALEELKEDTTNTITGVNVELKDVKKSISSFNVAVNNGAMAAKEFSDGVKQLHQVLGDFVTLVRSLFPETQEQAKKL